MARTEPTERKAPLASRLVAYTLLMFLVDKTCKLRRMCLLSTRAKTRSHLLNLCLNLLTGTCWERWRCRCRGWCPFGFLQHALCTLFCVLTSRWLFASSLTDFPYAYPPFQGQAGPPGEAGQNGVNGEPGPPGKRSTLNPQPSTLNPQPSTNPSLEISCGASSIQYPASSGMT